MNRNPLIPFALIAVLGLGFMFLLSFVGLNQANNLADGGGEEAAVLTADELYQQRSCLGCHGNELQGVSAPALADVGERLSEDEIKDIIINGQGTMPGNLATAEEATILAEWLANYGQEETE
ncbi:cytochrome c550 [Sutcliffiella cohnii]|uniref:Cytochrome C n=1 Tax=Sutcliffiella cohnii TaxID=33932 RepID=A0A223KSY0_9BACI|nr:MULTISPECIES: cytochrome c [Sutcliffiella]AST92601.1 cytochrome C [Sutcliffiella cohnii]MED4016508.1 cytochrome c [Sutcliffiella cohnii]WBL13841.1 cytochrome c [Sutcliffiella sp. NC1]